MKLLNLFVYDEGGQDLIEYALMAGFVAIGVGAIMPTVPGSLTTIYERVMEELAAVVEP